MGDINIKIEAGNGMTPEEKVKDLSKEIFNISRPDTVKNIKDGSSYRFGWAIHPTTGEAILKADDDFMMYVNSNYNLDELLKHFDKVSESEKKALKDYIASKSGQKIRFGDIIPSTTVYISEQKLIDDGW